MNAGRIAATLLVLTQAGAAPAEQVFSENIIIDGALCVGASCVAGEPGLVTMRVKAGITDIEFQDTSPSTYPDRDWRIQINETGILGREMFAVVDDTAATTPFAIEGGAPDAAAWLDDDGNLGLGTSLPMAQLHVVRGSQPTIRLDQDTSGGNAASTWDMVANFEGLFLREVQTGLIPVLIKSSGGNSHVNSLVIAPGGFVGHGTATPQTGLHLSRADGNAQLFVEDTFSTTGPRTLVNLQNNGRPEIVMGNTATGGEWSFGAGTNFILKQGAVGSTSAAKTKLFQVNANGDAELLGSLTTGGTTCGGGCDKVFTERAVIPAAEYHAQMWAQGHLPHVGPTPEGAPFNVTQKLGGMLNALEHAHVFIAAQGAEMAALRAQNRDLSASVAALQSRLTALESASR